ncbi:hypothetical protein [Streptomyces doudnae]|uniref:DUF4034 domain-containing protein n=2 Tax=Streptomyces TaxID=1883 RepID=A0ABD5EL73_9ACTN|nr:hypothetical protein [Streptomyces sp. DSM 41981]MDT0435336.1 hypothetical protein [Streptomyces sp. DSM 41981]
MVDTMALLPPFSRAARAPRTAPRRAVAPPAGTARPSPGGLGLPADDDVLLDVPDDRLGPALVAAARGEHGPASALLGATRRGTDWEHRDGWVRRLAAFARSRDEWFLRWSATAPHDPDLLTVRAQLAVDRAWPSPARAELLREVSPLITAAARGDDRDPVPWRVALDHARGSGAGHKYFEELWEAAVRRAPHHYGCHVAALRYLGTAYHGSHTACLDFAERAAQDAPAASLVQALPLHAVLAYLTDDCGPELPRRRLDEAADRAIALSARFPEADPGPAALRNQLMLVLVRLGRWRDAFAQARLIGPYATSYPWEQLSDDPLGLFLRTRDEVRAAWLTPPPGPPRSERGRHGHPGEH